MTPKGAQISGKSHCADCGEKVWQDAKTGKWFHPFERCKVTGVDVANLALTEAALERELAELDRIDRELEAS